MKDHSNFYIVFRRHEKEISLKSSIRSKPELRALPWNSRNFDTFNTYINAALSSEYSEWLLPLIYRQAEDSFCTFWATREFYVCWASAFREFYQVYILRSHCVRRARTLILNITQAGFVLGISLMHTFPDLTRSGYIFLWKSYLWLGWVGQFMYKSGFMLVRW